MVGHRCPPSRPAAGAIASGRPANVAGASRRRSLYAAARGVDRARDGGSSTGPAITWLGHASALIDLAGVTVLTDPALTDRVAHLRRHHHVEVAALGVPDVDPHLARAHGPPPRAVAAAVRPADVPIIVPSGAGGLLRRKGFRDVRETAAGRTTSVGPLTIETVPAVHGSRRGPHTRVAADAVGYVLRAGGVAVYFPGDTDLFPEMGDAGADRRRAAADLGMGTDDRRGPPRSRSRRAGDASSSGRGWSYRSTGARSARWACAGVGRSGSTNPVHRFREALERAGAGDRLRALDPGGHLVLEPPTIPER